MTVFEHAMLGASLGLAVGYQNRYGWRAIGMATAAGSPWPLLWRTWRRTRLATGSGRH